MSSRTVVRYGGDEYVIVDRDFDQVLLEVSQGMQAAEPSWLLVAGGVGRSTPTRILLAPGTAIAISEVTVDPIAEADVGAEVDSSLYDG